MAAVGLRVCHGMVAVSGGVAIVACSSDRVYALTWSCLRRCWGLGLRLGRRSYNENIEMSLSLIEWVSEEVSEEVSGNRCPFKRSLLSKLQ